MKNKFLTGKFIVPAILVLVILWAIGGYNGLVAAEETVNGAWANVETTYQERFDLVPNLVTTVQGQADFEQETLTAVTQARTQWQNAGSINEKVEAGNAFDSALSRLLVTVESYPTLTATQGFQSLQAQLEGQENRVRVARIDYNGTVKSFNTQVRRFPTNITAALFGFNRFEFFESDEGAENAPDVSFE